MLLYLVNWCFVGLGGNNPQVINFAMILAKIYLIDDRSNAQLIESDLFGTIEVLVQIANKSRSPPEGLVQIVDMITMSSERIEQNLQMSGWKTTLLRHFISIKFFRARRFQYLFYLIFDIWGPTSQLHSGIQQAREYEDPPGLMEKTEFLLRLGL